MKKLNRKLLPAFRRRVFRMVSVGVVDDPINACYDIVSTLALLVNLIAAFAVTFGRVFFTVRVSFWAVVKGLPSMVTVIWLL